MSQRALLVVLAAALVFPSAFADVRWANDPLVWVTLGPFDKDVPAPGLHFETLPPPPAPLTVLAPASIADTLLPSAHVTGTRTVVVITIEFSDITPTAAHDKPYYTSLYNASTFNAATGGSMRHYYETSSYGAFSVRGHFPVCTSGGGAECRFDIWVKSSRTRAFYGADCHGPGSDDCNVPIYELAREAIIRADPYVDFSAFDTDANGFVDSVSIVYAGDSQSDSGVANDVWAHRWAVQTLPSNPSFVLPGSNTGGTCGGYGQLADGKCIRGYFAQGETTSAGTHIHEFGHDLGLPDLYDTNGGSFGIGRWGPMAQHRCGTGSPVWIACPMDANQRIRLGWLAPLDITAAGSTTVSLTDINDASGTRVVRVGGFASDAGEYFLIENRQTGDNEYANASLASGLGRGVLITHIDDTVWNANLNTNTVNADETNKGMDVETADATIAGNVVDADQLDSQANYGDVGDTFFSGNGAAGYEGRFSPSTTPGSIANPGGSLTLNICVGGVAGAAFPASANVMIIDVSRGCLDTTVPVAAVTNPTAGAVRASTFTVTMTASDNVGVTAVSLGVDGVFSASGVSCTPALAGSPASTTCTATRTLGGGAHTLAARATDVSGNNGTSANVTMSVDAAPPAGVFISPAASVTGAPSLLVRANVSDALGLAATGGAILAIDGGAPVSMTCSGTSTARTCDATWALPSLGAHVLRLTVTDGVGLQTNVTTNVTVVDVASPVVAFTNPSAPGLYVNGMRVTSGTSIILTGTLVAIAATGYDAESGISTAQVLVDGGTRATLAGTSQGCRTAGTPCMLSGSFSIGRPGDAGTHALAVRVTDAVGHSTTATLVVTIV